MVLGVSFDAVAKNAAFAARFGYRFRMLSDVDKVAGAAYDAIELDGEDAGWPRRVSFLIDRAGTIARVYAPVDVGSHAATVLADLAAGVAGP